MQPGIILGAGGGVGQSNTNALASQDVGGTAGDTFTDLAIDMVKVGEATGALDSMLASVSDFLDEEVETRMQRILSLIEPLMLVFMGTIVALLLVSVYLPMFSMLGKIQ